MKVELNLYRISFPCLNWKVSIFLEFRYCENVNNHEKSSGQGQVWSHETYRVTDYSEKISMFKNPNRSDMNPTNDN